MIEKEREREREREREMKLENDIKISNEPTCISFQNTRPYYDNNKYEINYIALFKLLSWKVV